jgi:hypothetical protein
MKKLNPTVKEKAKHAAFTLLYSGGMLATTLLVLAESGPKLPRSAGD